MKRTSPTLPRAGVLALAAALLLSACAGQRAYRDGRELIAQNKVEEGLQKMQQAVNEDPRSPQFRAGLMQAREKAVYDLLRQGDRLQASDPGAAAEAYRRVLALESSNARASAGLLQIEARARQQKWLDEAKSALEKKDNAGARSKISLILVENPAHPGAVALQKELNELARANSPQTQMAQSLRKPITIEFKDASVKQVFEVIARTAGLNILFDKDVRQDQRMSIYLKNSNVEAAIHYALMTNQLEQQVMDGNTILIFPNQPAKQKEYQEVLVRSFFLTNAEAKAVANSIKTIVKTRDVVVDEKLNMIVLRDSADAIKVAEKLIALHDQPEPEVMLEVEVLEIKRTKLTELGINWPEKMNLTLLPSTAGGKLLLSDVRSNINSRTVEASVGQTTVVARTVDSDVNLLANPRIRARNREKAKFMIGERVPNITSTSTSTGFVSESVNYVEVGLKLEVEPNVYLDNDVGIKVMLEVSNIVSESQTKSGSNAYRIGTRTASTALRLKDGETQVLAGLINDEERKSGNKVPGLGELPLLGRLFGSGLGNNEKTEIVLAITPRLVRNITRPESTIAEFRAGTDSSMRVRPDAPSAPVTLPSRSSASASSSLPGAVSTGAGMGAGSAPAPAPVKTDIGGNLSTGAGNAGSTSGGIYSPPNPGSSAGTGATGNLETGSAPPAPTPPQMQWQGPPVVKVGENFSLQLVLRSDQPIASLPLAIGFDPKVLQVTAVSEGDFLKQGGGQTVFTSKVESSGQVLASVTRSNGGASEGGSIITLTLRALAATDSSRVQLITIAPVTASGSGVVAQMPAPYVVQIRP
ncbi:cohesin domain-containing protein [Massilia sp. W12]|uniref:cohesin domain-containing protein n=1 Tax=Massilia sp. W12 TaxID=3126507 RepID=UPI0030CFCF18